MTDIDHRTEHRRGFEPSIRCPQCEQERLVNRHCKRVCERCGYVESCEDNFVPNQSSPHETAVGR